MTVATYNPDSPVVSLSETALQHFRSKLGTAGSDKLVRLSTAPSGCSGLSYVLDMVESPQEGDEVVDAGDSIRLAIDPKALEVLRGTEIDLVDEGVNRVLKFNNPNVVAECGCGESFSVS